MWNNGRRTKTWMGALSIGVLAALSGLSAYVRAAPSVERATEQGQSTVAIEIPEVSCAGCSPKARKAVKSAGGVLRLGEGDSKNQLVVTFEPGPGRPGAYVEALRAAGFANARQVTRR